MSLYKVPSSETAPDKQPTPTPRTFILKEEEVGTSQREKGDPQRNRVVVRKQQVMGEFERTSRGLRKRGDKREGDHGWETRARC